MGSNHNDQDEDQDEEGYDDEDDGKKTYKEGGGGGGGAVSSSISLTRLLTCGRGESISNANECLRRRSWHLGTASLLRSSMPGFARRQVRRVVVALGLDFVSRDWREERRFMTEGDTGRCG